MTFLEELRKLNFSDSLEIIQNACETDVRRVLSKEKPDFNDYLTLLSNSASNILEELAVKAQYLTKKFFGKTIQLYAPLYLGNECDNNCVYCGFSQPLSGKRLNLSVGEVLSEAEILYGKGFRHVLLVSGEKRSKITLPYLKEVVSELNKKFDSISLEIFPLEEDEYRELFKAGADGITIYQEVYNEDVYKKVHKTGPKSNYEFRLLTPERAGSAGFYKINIGALLGLNNWAEEATVLGLHAAYLKKSFWRSQVAVSFPRLKTSVARFKPPHPVSDRKLVQMICALRIFMPSISLVLSTREGVELRDNLIPLGITQLSANSRTSPGGYSEKFEAEEQFEISDRRSLAQVTSEITKRGYDPIYKDWDKSLK
jgi:2-iminoacetate synthase